MNIKKVYIFIAIIILVMSISVGVSASKINDAPPPINSTFPDDLYDDQTQNDNNDSQDQTGTTNPSTPTKPVKIYTNGYTCLTDAFALFDNAKGYKVTSTFQGVTDIYGIGSATQNIYETFILSGDYYLKETTASCSVSMGQNFYRYFYSNDNGQNVEYKKYKINSDNTPNTSAVIEQATTSKQGIIDSYDLMAYDVFNIRPTKSNSSLVKFDRVSDKNFYLISFTLEPSKIPDAYRQTAIKEGNLKDMKINTLKLTYYIEKQTLQIKRVIREEDYNINMGLEFNVKVNQTYRIENFDQVLAPQKPF